MKTDLMNRLISYAKVNTQSNEDNATCPSTSGQLVLGKQLVEELKKIGMQEVTMDDHGYVMATLPSNIDHDVPTIGFLAHVDTATDFTGENVNPKIVENYDGGDVVLNDSLNVILSPRDFPELKNYIGHTLITTDGTTLLGADNKAGISEIMTAMDYLIQHPDIKHGRVRVAFTPDEEIGRGPHKFDVKAFDATYAYTVDGGPLGELQYESFNASSAKIIFKGSNVHPGSAKGKMLHSAKLAIEFHEQLPSEEAPEYTEGYEGFYHLTSFNGDVEKTTLQYIIRDHDRDRFEARKETFTQLAKNISEKYGADSVSFELHDQYYNMREKIEPVREIIDLAAEAMRALDIEPKIGPIRGGTDGSQISFMGLPTPNIFTGGENFHGKFEYISADVMEQATKVIIEILKRFEAR